MSQGSLITSFEVMSRCECLRELSHIYADLVNKIDSGNTPDIEGYLNDNYPSLYRKICCRTRLLTPIKRYFYYKEDDYSSQQSTNLALAESEKIIEQPGPDEQQTQTMTDILELGSQDFENLIATKVTISMGDVKPKTIEELTAEADIIGSETQSTIFSSKQRRRRQPTSEKPLRKRRERPGRKTQKE